MRRVGTFDWNIETGASAWTPELEVMYEGMMRMGRGSVEGQGVPLDVLIRAISGQLGRPVIDRTGLSGNFDIKLQWTPDPGQAPRPFGDAPPAGVEPPPSDPNGPSIFTALQEQLGLRLESQKGPVDLLVIDRVEKPSENCIYAD
jgi:bla regulator protein blaR1